jgi:ankyrin repeat protein
MRTGFLCFIASVVWAATGASVDPAHRLIEAARQDDGPSVEALLARHGDVNDRSSDGATALAWAVMHNNVEMSTRLLSAGANPNLVNVYGVGPLSLAVTNGSAELVQLLLRKGADPNAARDSGETPLMSAARMGRVDLMQLLVDRGANVNQRDKKFGQTVLMWAAGDPEAVRLLLAHKADPLAATRAWDVKATIYTPSFRTLGVTGIPWNFDGDYTSKKGGQNALFFAVQRRSLESARLLVDAGVDVNLPSADGTTPLLLALYKWEGGEGRGFTFAPDLPMASYLLDRGAKVSVTDGAGYTPLHGAVLAAVGAMRGGGRGRGGRGGGGGNGGIGPSIALSEPEVLKVVQRLLDSGADPNRQTLYPTSGPVGNVRINPAAPGSSAFHIAATSTDVALTKMLADKGANPNLLRKDGETPFTLAVEANNVEVVKEMVARGANLSMRYNPTAVVPDPAKPVALRRENQTIMHLAAVAGAARTIEYLFSAGAPLDATNAQGETPLRMAVDHEVFEQTLAYEGTNNGGGKRVPLNTTTSDAIQRCLAQKTGK